MRLGSKRWRALPVALVLATGCSAAAPGATSALPPAPLSASLSCSGPVPRSDNGCLEPSCVQGRWTLEPVGPRVPCELPPYLAERQSLMLEAFRDDPGVCFRGQCLPRFLCATTCGAELGKELGPPVLAELRSCWQAHPEKQGRNTCSREAGADQRRERAIGQRALACIDQCGLPRPTVSSTLQAPEP
jgi:hypothetical protein